MKLGCLCTRTNEIRDRRLLTLRKEHSRCRCALPSTQLHTHGRCKDHIDKHRDGHGVHSSRQSHTDISMFVSPSTKFTLQPATDSTARSRAFMARKRNLGHRQRHLRPLLHTWWRHTYILSFRKRRHTRGNRMLDRHIEPGRSRRKSRTRCRARANTQGEVGRGATS